MPHEERALGKRGHQRRPNREVEVRTPLAAVFFGGIVIDGRTIVNAAERRQDRIAFGRVEVSTRRIGA